jgi:DNA-directed RNA polymerase subunit N (RpoN/RPB10)
MLVPVVCITCGCPIGDVADLYRHMRAARVRSVLAERGTLPTQAAVDAGLQIPCEDIFVALDVMNDCCRGHLATAMIFSDYY